jgi:hypothetical protein
MDKCQLDWAYHTIQHTYRIPTDNLGNNEDVEHRAEVIIRKEPDGLERLSALWWDLREHRYGHG